MTVPSPTGERATEQGRTKWILLAIVTVAVLVSLGTPLLGQARFFGGDSVLPFSPWNTELTDRKETVSPRSDFVDVQIGQLDEIKARASDGDFPEWDPLSASGSPLISIPSGIYTPMALPYFVLPLTYAPVVVKLIEFAVAIGGMYLVCRRMALDRPAALAGGAVYAFSGFQTMWTSWPQSGVAAFIPWLFWAAERAIDRRRASDVAIVAIVMTLMLVGGFPAIVAYAVWSLAAFLVVRALVAHVQAHAIARVDGEARPPTWVWLREQLSGGVRIGIGLVLGVGLAAWQILPQYSRLSDDVLAARANAASVPMAAKSVATVVFPHAFGVLNQTPWFGPANEVETVSYLGAGALVLCAAALLFTRWRDPTLPVMVAAAALLGFIAWGMFRGGVPLRVMAELPGISSSPIGRIRCMVGFFAALLAAGGLHAVRRRVPIDRRGAVLRAGVAVVGLVGLVFVAHKVRGFASAQGRLDQVDAWMMVGLASAAAMVALVVAARRRSVDVVAIGAVALVAAEALFFVVPYFPRVDNASSMPVTDVHRYLQDDQDLDGRIITDGLTLYPGTTRYYGLRTVTSHAFHQAEYKDLLTALDPAAFAASSTFSMVGIDSLDRITSPILDRMAADVAVLPVEATVFGSVDAAMPAAQSGDDAVVEITGAFRGIEITPSRAVPARGEASADGSLRWLMVDVVADGEVVADAHRVVRGPLTTEAITIPVVAEQVSPTASVTVTIRLEDPESGMVDALPPVSVAPIRPADDTLELVHVAGSAVWRRATALPRVRWASDAVQIVDPTRRVAALAAGTVPDDTVVLDVEPAASVGGPGQVVEFSQDDPDSLSVEVDSQDGGWLVVADTIQDGWSASIDGRAVDVLDADHAFGAVEVPPGRHSIRLRYQTPGATRSTLVTGTSAMVVVALVATPMVLRRRSRTGSERRSTVPLR